jgi:hypothetical protein
MPERRLLHRGPPVVQGGFTGIRSVKYSTTAVLLVDHLVLPSLEPLWGETVDGYAATAPVIREPHGDLIYASAARNGSRPI